MKKNVAGQKIGAQLIDATTGAAFSGSVTAYVTGDAGTQSAGSVGAGACTSEGNGYYTYAPAQAETNYDLIAFTFTGTGAIPATVQVYTDFPQTGDSFGLIGATGSGLTSLASQASVNTIDGIVDDILVDTAEIGVAGAGLTNINLPDQTMNITGNLFGSVGSVTGLTVGHLDVAVSTRLATAGYTAPDNASIADILVDTGTTLPATLATIAGYIDTEIATLQTSVNDIPTNSEFNARTLASADYATAAALTTVDGVVDANKVILDKLDTALVLDGSVYQFTANALELAPSGGGGGLTAADVWSHGTRTLTAGTNIVLAKGTGITGFNDLSAAQVNAEADAALSDVGLTTTVTGRIDAAISTRLASASYTAPDNAGIGWLITAVDALPTNSELATALSGLATATALQTVDDNVDSVKAKTDQLTFTVAGQIDANAESMNGAEILGNGTAGNLWRGE
jgi:hypothetical protein